MGEARSGPMVAYVGYVSATLEEVFHPDVELIGDIGTSVTALADALHQWIKPNPEFLRLRDEIHAHINGRASDDRFPVIPQLSCMTFAASSRKTESFASTTACTRSGSHATIAPPSPIRYYCLTTRWRPWRRFSFRHCGQVPQSAKARPRHMRRRRLHDEQPGTGNRGPSEARPRRSCDRRLRLRNDPLEAGFPISG